MAEEERRLTKRERREQARRERRQAEVEAARQARRKRIIGWLTALAIAAVVGAVLWVSLAGSPGTISEPIVLDPAELEQAQQAAGCELLDVPPHPSADHINAAGAPPAAALYNVRPTHSGPHFDATHPVGTFSGGAEERSVTHNLEHGAVAVWWDPQRVPADQVRALEAWAERLNASGFEQRAGTGIITSPFEEPFTSGKSMAFRSWGIAMDCEEWNETAADGFVARFYGTNGFGPEAATFAPHPGLIQISRPEGSPEPSPDGVTVTPAPSPAAEPSPAASPTS